MSRADWLGDVEKGKWDMISVRKLKHCPWGYYEVLDTGPGYKVKRLTVDPGKRTSLQWHEKRVENWSVVAGEGSLTEGEQTRLLFHHRTEITNRLNIRKERLHCIHNTGEEPLVIIEVQTYDEADPSTEEDVHRVEDDWGRACRGDARDGKEES